MEHNSSSISQIFLFMQSLAQGQTKECLHDRLWNMTYFLIPYSLLSNHQSAWEVFFYEILSL